MKNRQVPKEAKTFFNHSLDENSRIEAFSFPYGFKEDLVIPKEYQEAAVNHIYSRYEAGETFSGLLLCTGAGKSKVASIAISQLANKNPNVRFVIAIPQEVIAGSWRHNDSEKDCNFLINKENWDLYKNLSEKDQVDWKKTFKSNKDYIAWGLSCDLCDSAGKCLISEDGKIKEAIKFLRDPVGSLLHSRTLLVTHATLSQVYIKLKEQEERHLLSNAFIVIDECHHLFVDSGDNSNLLGDMVSYIFDNEDLNSHVCGLTATFFRGDKRRIISDKLSDIYENAFYELPFDEYFKYFKHLKNFSYDFGIFSASEGYEDCVSNAIKKHGLSNTLVFLPSRTQGKDSVYSKTKKEKNINEVLKGIVSSFGWKGRLNKRKCKTSEDKFIDGYFEIQVSEKKWIKVLDAVLDENGYRKDVKKLLKNINNGKDNVDVIIALGMCKEGFDWVSCDRIILIGNTKSLVSLVQINGRMIRDFNGKEQSIMTWLLPTDSGIEDKDISKDLNEVFMSLNMALLMCLDIINPINVSVNDKENPGKEMKISGKDILFEVFGTVEKVQKFLEIVCAEVCTEIQDKKQISPEERLSIVTKVLNSFNIDQNTIFLYSEAIATYTKVRLENLKNNKAWLTFNKHSSLVKEMCELHDIVNPENLPAECLLGAFASEIVGIKTYSELRKSCNIILGNYSKEKFEELKKRVKIFCNKYNKYPQENDSNKEENDLALYIRKWKENPIILGRQRERILEKTL